VVAVFVMEVVMVVDVVVVLVVDVAVTLVVDVVVVLLVDVVVSVLAFVKLPMSFELLLLLVRSVSLLVVPATLPMRPEVVHLAKTCSAALEVVKIGVDGRNVVAAAAAVVADVRVLMTNKVR